MPANIYPVMMMDYAGRHSENTIWDGVIKLYQDGSWFIASIVFVASILVPLLKLLGLFWLVTSTGSRWQMEREPGLQRHLFFSVPGRCSTFSFWPFPVALVRFGKFATILPGPGMIAFSGVVVLTILASSSFDPRLIWEEQGA